MFAYGCTYVLSLLFHGMGDQVLHHGGAAGATGACFGTLAYGMKIFAILPGYRLAYLRFGHSFATADQCRVGKGIQAGSGGFMVDFIAPPLK